jgi:hypothetical protein
MPRSWQKIDGEWLVCHWWQKMAGWKITAIATDSHQEAVMTAIVVSIVLVAAAAVLALAVHALYTVIRNDGYYPRRTTASPVGVPPRSHPADTFDPRSRLA